MSNIGGKQHEEVLEETIEGLRNQGYKVINLKAKSPDAIAVIDGKITAILVLGKSYNIRERKWRGSWTRTQKEKTYSMFDDIIIKTFKRGNAPLK